jgi:hypothetical protein
MEVCEQKNVLANSANQQQILDKSANQVSMKEFEGRMIENATLHFDD